MSIRPSVARVIRLGAEALGVYAQHNLVQPLRRRPALPRSMHYLATHRCNARCIMCGIWKEHSSPGENLTPDELSAVLADPLFSRMEYVGVSGGEPLLRNDLVPLTAAIVEGCPRLKRYSLTTNGLLGHRAATLLPQIADVTSLGGVLFDVSISVHGLGVMQDRIYGVKHAFEKLQQTLGIVRELAQEGRLTFSFNSVLLSMNLDGADALFQWGTERGVPVNFVVGEQRERFRTDGLESAFVNPEQRRRLTDFLRRLAARADVGAAASIKYRELADILDGRKKRTLSCYYAMGGLVLGHDGTMYYCPHSKPVGNCRDGSAYTAYYDPANVTYRRRALLGGRCSTCPPYTRTRREIEKDLGRILLEIGARRVGLRAGTR